MRRARVSAFTFLLTIKCVEPYLRNRRGVRSLSASHLRMMLTLKKKRKRERKAAREAEAAAQGGAVEGAAASISEVAAPVAAADTTTTAEEDADVDMEDVKAAVAGEEAEKEEEVVEAKRTQEMPTTNIKVVLVSTCF